MALELIKASVIIPTYQRPRQLGHALESLRAQKPHDFEILVIDNEPNPEVERLVLNKQCEFAVPLIYLPESKLGLHHARHAGARAARGEILVFTDDDASFDLNWVHAYIMSFSAHQEMAAAGGPVRPVWEVPPPKWLEEFTKNKTIFPILSLSDPNSGFCLGPRGYFLGVNMAIRRSTLFKVGGFNPDSFGDVWMGNGESGLNRKLWQREMLVGYVPNAIVYHHIPAERMTVEYFKRRMANEGACDMYSRFHDHVPGQIGLAGSATSIILRNLVLWVVAWFVDGRTDRWSLQAQMHAARSQAQLRYISRLRSDEHFRSFVMARDWLNGPCTSA